MGAQAHGPGGRAGQAGLMPNKAAMAEVKPGPHQSLSSTPLSRGAVPGDVRAQSPSVERDRRDPRGERAGGVRGWAVPASRRRGLAAQDPTPLPEPPILRLCRENGPSGLGKGLPLLVTGDPREGLWRWAEGALQPHPHALIRILRVPGPDRDLGSPVPVAREFQAPLSKRRPSPGEMTTRGSRELILVWLLVLAAAGSTDHAYRPGRRVCAVRAPGAAVVFESFVQRVYQPFLTTCDGHRACSTYRTIYKTAYRRNPGQAPARPRYACCPGWKTTSRLPMTCGAAVCQPPCQNGGSCVQPGRCHCPAGWQGNTCQTDVDECGSGRGSCPQHCVNTVGSYQCRCPEGHQSSADGTLCLPMGGPPTAPPSPGPGVDSQVDQEVLSLRSRVAMLEQKLQLVLAPLHSLASRALQLGLPDPGSLLAHSFRQLERIDSLSEQISFLEEQLGACSCKKEL
ncbi:PREDICTED: epidermal growth factor-like protein 7 [Chrysochloris asiatica]|uniref:Epidermal growth factor-like protein 7 n=1 Tax=Chrysochloris asiatica TaxID=185453 RepID=A0A9B0TJV0_CHRAS|nr:PREDICTED: epidermal growth factor-like protein 7 [Chrysochloris asiatica]